MVLPPTQSNKGVEYVNIYKKIFIEGSKSWQNKREFTAGNLSEHVAEQHRLCQLTMFTLPRPVLPCCKRPAFAVDK